MQRLHVDGWRGRVRSRLRPEHPSRPLQELSLPGRDLVGMDIELLGQFSQRLLALHGGQSHLRFESRRVVPAGSSAHRFSCSAAILAAVRQKLHSSTLFKNPEPALLQAVSWYLRYPLRVCPGTSCGIAEPSQHEADRGKAEEGERLAVEVLPILGQSTAAVQPSYGAFDNPALR